MATTSNKTLLLKWEKQLEYIEKNAPKKKDKSSVIRITKAKKDFNYFVKIYMSHNTMNGDGKNIPLAKFHLEFVEALNQNRKGIYLNIWARNHAKTTIIKFYILWSILTNKYKNIVYVCQSKDMAMGNLLSIQSELTSESTLLYQDFGPFVTDGHWTKSKFVIQNETQITALGSGQNPRGFNFRNVRPDLIICDDLDTDETCRNKESLDNLFNWFAQTLTPTVDIAKIYKVLVIGNAYAGDMLLVRIKDRMKPTYFNQINAYDSEGNISWPERFKEEHFEFERSKGEIQFLREYMNEAIVEGALFKREWMQWKPLQDFNKYETIVTYYDPSYSKNSDYKCILTLGFLNAEYHILDIFLRRCEMKDAAYYLYELFERLERVKSNFVMMMEASFMQGEIHKMFIDEVGMEKNIFLPLIYDKEVKANKQQRIETMTPYFQNNKFYFDEYKKTGNDQIIFIDQLLSFNYGSSKNDDGPDALESAMNNINKRIRQQGPLITGRINRNDYY